MNHVDEIIKEALGEMSQNEGNEIVELFAKSAARGYYDWMGEKTAAVEQASNEAVAGSTRAEVMEDPATHAETVTDEMVAEAVTALKEDCATHTQEGATAFKGEQRVASAYEEVFDNAFAEELGKLAATGEPTEEDIVNDAATTKQNTEALQEGAGGVDEAAVAEEIAAEMARREAPGSAGTQMAR
jgi:hypothetical protein